MSKLLVIYGFQGDLFRRKLLMALWAIFITIKKAGGQPDFRILGIGRRPIEDLEAFLNEAAVEFGIKRDVGLWDEFLKLFTYSVNRPGANGFQDPAREIRKFQMICPEGKILFYLSVPYSSNIPILEQLRETFDFDEHAGKKLFVLFEKPAEICLKRLAKMEELLSGLRIPLKNVGIVEHFAMKHGFKQFLTWMYERESHREVLTSKNVRRVQIIVKEVIGMEGRDYPGIMVDSILNHHLALLGAVLGNPLDNGWALVGSELTARLGKLLFCPKPDLPEEQIAKERTAFYRTLSAYGAYAMCRHDHGKPQHIPTGVHLCFRPKTNRWDGSTVFDCVHLKNTNEKVTEVRFFLKGGETWKFVIDGFEHSNRVWGWQKISRSLRADEQGYEPSIEGRFRVVPEESIDGYPGVVRKFLEGRMENFMPLEFQRTGIQLCMPWAGVLDKTAVESRVWFNQGTYPFPQTEKDIHVLDDHNAYLNAAGLYPLNPVDRAILGESSIGWHPSSAELAALSAI